MKRKSAATADGTDLLLYQEEPDMRSTSNPAEAIGDPKQRSRKRRKILVPSPSARSRIKELKKKHNRFLEMDDMLFEIIDDIDYTEDNGTTPVLLAELRDPEVVQKQSGSDPETFGYVPKQQRSKKRSKTMPIPKASRSQIKKLKKKRDDLLSDMDDLLFEIINDTDYAKDDGMTQKQNAGLVKKEQNSPKRTAKGSSTKVRGLKVGDGK